MSTQQEQDVSQVSTATPVITEAPQAQTRDDMELQAALAEQTAAKPAETPAAPAVTEPATTQPAEPAEAHKGNPTAALIAQRKKIQELATQNLLLTGQIQALTTVVRPPAQAEVATEEAPPADTIQTIRQAQVALAEQFDAGEISAKDMELRRQELADKEWELRAASIQPVHQAPATDLYLEQETAKIEAENKFLSIVPVDEMDGYALLARRQLEREGVQIVGATGTLAWRQRIVELAKRDFGGPATPTVPTTTTALSPEAQAREAKLKLASTMPMDVTKLGSSASSGAMSEAEVLARMDGMNEAEQIALLESMPGLSARIMGG
ncbi:MAG: hypothetical protein IPM01_29530 [Burkholderiaceae bacterium]|nr:hypothetical protein [Burkholderiaceae bacterium]